MPQAKIVHDKFHVSKHLNEAVDKVRRRENNALQAEGDDRLKGARQLFLFNPENLPKDRVADFEALKNSDLKAARAWAIKESFRGFWQCKTLTEAQGVFKKLNVWPSTMPAPRSQEGGPVCLNAISTVCLTSFSSQSLMLLPRGLTPKSNPSRPMPEGSVTSSTTASESSSSAEALTSSPLCNPRTCTKNLF